MMSKGSKRKGWRSQRDLFTAIGRELESAATAPPTSPPVPEWMHAPLSKRRLAQQAKDAERERLRQIVRDTLAGEA